MTNNPYAPPESAVADTVEGEAWRQRRDVIIRRHDASFPHRCIKCNADAKVVAPLRLSYLNPWFYLLFFINIFVLLLVGLIFQKSVRVAVPLCKDHHRRHRRFVRTMWVLFFAGIVALVAAALHQSGELLAVILVLLLIGAVVAIGGRLVYARKIDKEFVWVRGAGDRFLRSLPEFRL